MLKTAIILAGGKGTRIASVTNNQIPKVMLEFNGKPFLETLVEILVKQGIEKVILSIGFLNQYIIDYFNSHQLKKYIDFNIENEQLGTGGAVLDSIKNFGLNTVNQPILVMNGDSFNQSNVQDFCNKHLNNNNDITIMTKYLDDASRYGLVKIDDDRITKFEEKQHGKQGFISLGVYIINSQSFDKFNMQNIFSIEKDFFEKYVNDIKIGSYINNQYFIDFGIPEDYEKAKLELPNLCN